MAKSNNSLFETDPPVLRFEESDDFQTHPGNQAYPGHETAPHTDHHSSSGDHYDELKQKQEELLRKRQDLERTQREAQELQQRQEKEERFSTGRKEISEKLSRALSRLERDLMNAQRCMDEIVVARESFQNHLSSLYEIRPETWKRTMLDEHLDRAIGEVEDAEDDYTKISRRLSAVIPEAGLTPPASVPSVTGGFALPQDFRSLLRLGFAFSLPLIIAAVVVLLLAKILP